MSSQFLLFPKHQPSKTIFIFIPYTWTWSLYRLFPFTCWEPPCVHYVMAHVIFILLITFGSYIVSFNQEHNSTLDTKRFLFPWKQEFQYINFSLFLPSPSLTFPRAFDGKWLDPSISFLLFHWLPSTWKGSLFSSFPFLSLPSPNLISSKTCGLVLLGLCTCGDMLHLMPFSFLKV